MKPYRTVALGDICSFKYGQMPDDKDKAEEGYPIFSGYRVVGHASRFHYGEPEIIVVARGIGGTGDIKWSPPNCFLTNLAIAILVNSPEVDKSFLYYRLASTKMWDLRTGSAQAQITINHLRQYEVDLPSLPLQRKIAAVLSAYDDLIENNIRRIKILEEMAQRIYREWFVDFRYPGHEDVPLVDSELGPIPEGWEVRTIATVAGSAQYAVTSGPFGSKLGSKDYVADGVPVIRGTNLGLGGAFRDTGFVFVSNVKADEMQSCLARPGDIVITQRGTLGQVGRIPDLARYERYVLSQSQMKITVDGNRGCSDYLYAAMRSPQVTQRIQSHAMTAGVPHINLSILREFPVVWPDVNLQAEAGRSFGLLGNQVLALTRIADCAREARDLLLPRFISGEVDVSDLDIEIP